jgi:hypothetical protein
MFASCKSSKQTNSASKDTSETRAAIALLPIVVSTESAGNDPFEIGKMRISGDTLFMDVTYSGGCKEHAFSGRNDGNIMKSLPPQMNVTIDHQANGDGCRSLISKTLAFDLTNCRSGKTGSIVLIVNGDRGNKITYTY